MKITIKECKNPNECLKCVKACPLKVFVVKPLGTRRLSSYVERWEIKPLFRDLCDGCLKCIEVCPSKAISMKP